ncbi:unnamed protein product, partial [Iphiclides podalirius]
MFESDDFDQVLSQLDLPDESCNKTSTTKGLLSGSFEEYKDEDVGRIEFLSQEIFFSQNPLQKGIFESPLWKKLLQDLNIWNLTPVDSIKTVKQLALNGNLKCRKAQTITAFVESVDRSALDPLVTLRDLTGNIKCTLHRDAWSHFSSYIIPECCALILFQDEENSSPDGYEKFSNEDYTVFKMERGNSDLYAPTDGEATKSSNDFFEDLDNVFCDEIF